MQSQLSLETASTLIREKLVAPSERVAMSPRTWRLLHGPIVPTLVRLAWPNILVMLAQASTGLIETWWVSRLGTDALTGMALVFPGFMMMTMLSAGAIGGGISSAVARALGAERRRDADALVLHAILINLVLGVAAGALFLVFGRQLYGAMGGEGASLDAAMRYSNVVFAGNVLIWFMNALASVIRGTGNMLVPSLAICLGGGAAGPAVAAADLWLWPAAGHGHRWRCHGNFDDDLADDRGAGVVHPVRPLRGSAALGTAELAPCSPTSCASVPSVPSAPCRRR